METIGNMTDGDGIVVFDTSSGISVEEQQEILAGINAMASGNRLVQEAIVTKAKKRGFLFPLLVNSIALILLGLGFALLFLLHGQDEQDIRENSASLGQTERILIQEIRQETNRQISEKEKEINGILSKLSAADAEYRELQVSVDTLSEAQKERAAELLLMQEDYHQTLSGLQDERTKIIEDSRLQEANLRSQAVEREKELSSQVEQSQADLGAAMEELRQLSTEQERASRVEAQMGGYYTAENNLISSGRLDEATANIVAMREFLNAASLGIRSLDAKKKIHLAAISAMEGALAEARRLKEAAPPGGEIVPVQQNPVSSEPDEAFSALEANYAALEARHAALEQKTADQERTIAALNSQDSEQSKIVVGFQSTINELRTENSKLSTANINQQETLNRRDAEILNLRTENASKEQEAVALNANAAALRAQVQTANNRAQDTEAALAEQRRQNAALLAEREELKNQYEELQRRMDAAVKAVMGN